MSLKSNVAAAAAALTVMVAPTLKRRSPMRSPIFSLVLVSAALMGAADPASAQSAYSYPWCGQSYAGRGATSCYFTSYQQCMTTLSGIGGYCYQSPYYHASPPAYVQAAATPRRDRRS